MDYPLPPEQRELQTRILRFVETELDELARGVDPEDIPSAIRKRVASLSEAADLRRLAVPSEDGGLGAGPLPLTAAQEALALSGNPLARLVLTGGPGLMRLANNDSQRASLYEPVLRGERTTAFGFTEPQGSERTRAERTTLPDGQPGFLVTGQKSFVTGGPQADWIIVMANVLESEGEPSGGALLIIDRDAPGVTMGDANTTMDGSSHVPFSFENTPVPADRMLGEVGQGMPRAMGGIRAMRMSVAAQSVGSSRWICRYTLAKIEAPHRSGQPLADREQIQAIFADMVSETLSAQSTIYRVAAQLEAEPDAELNTEVAVAKMVATETFGRVVDRAIQLYGGLALARGNPLERLYRQARTLRIAEGTTEILKLTVTKDIRQRGVEGL
jgi:alkylation response protein AidB-like acyl-CoA dehydrogenase